MNRRRPRLAALALVVSLAALAAVPAAAQTGAPASQPAPKPRAKPRKAKEPVFQDRTLSSWVADLKAAAPYTRTQAAYAISGMGAAAAPAVPALVEALKDEEGPVRIATIVALTEIGDPGAKPAIPALQNALDDRNEDVAHLARRALRRLGVEPKPTDDD